MGPFSNKGSLPTLGTKSDPQFWECPIFEGESIHGTIYTKNLSWQLKMFTS
jgi:hypothetical protein